MIRAGVIKRGRTVAPQWVSPQAFGAVGNGVADDTAALRLWLSACRIGSRVELPEGKIYKYSGTLNLNVPGVWMRGPGEFFNADPGTEYAAGRGSSYTGLNLGPLASGFLATDVIWRGTNDPFGGINGLIAEGQTEVFAECSGVAFNGCQFRNLWGHTIKSFGGGEHHGSVQDCTFFECTNGLNLNGPYSRQIRNAFEKCNGTECAGTDAYITDCTFVDSTGVSLGGNGNGEAGVVRNCYVARCTFTRPQQGSALNLSGAANALCEDITIIDASDNVSGFHGVQSRDSTADNVPGWVTAPAGANVFRRITATMKTGNGGHLLWIQHGDGSVVEDCVLEDASDALYAAVLQAPNLVFRRNRCAGALGAILVQSHLNTPLTVTLCGNTGAVTQSPASGGPITLVAC